LLKVLKNLDFDILTLQENYSGQKVGDKTALISSKNRFSHRAKVSTAFNVLTPTKSMKENDEQSTMML